MIAGLSVAIPTCNGARHLASTLRTILAQEPGDFDLIVADDRSDDGTLEVVRDLAGDRARVTVNSERLGLAGNWNRCVAVATTPLVAIFHQDDLMRPGHLKAHRMAFARDPNLGLVASASAVVDEDGREVPPTVVGRGGLGPSDLVFAAGEALPWLAVENPLRCSAVTLNVEAHAEAGGFDPSYRYVVDWDFWRRVAGRRSLAWLANPSVDVRWHSASETHQFKDGTADLDETTRLLDAIARDEKSARRLRPAADRWLSRAFLNRAHDALHSGDAVLARKALQRAVRLSPTILATIAADPRLAAQMGALVAAPRWAARTFRRRLE